MSRRTLAALLAACALPIVVAVAPVGTPPASALPAGFTLTEVAPLDSPTGIEQLPDGRVLVLQQSGEVRIVANGALSSDVVLDLAVCTGSERGLLGVTADPQFLSNGYVYLYYTRTAGGSPGGCVNRVSRFTLTGSTIAPASELVLLDDISSINGNHNGGDLAIGRDGHLYVSVGDAGSDPRGNSGAGGNNDAAQDLSLLNGKILRVDRTTGEAPPGNPFVAAGAASCRLDGGTTPGEECAEIYAYGLRNPWRMAFDPNGSEQRFFINDVGQSTREEVNLGAVGANYGWNTREGQCPRGQNPPCAGPTGGLVDPITDYQNVGARAFITAGAFVPNGSWPAEYDGGYLFGDGGSGEIWLRRADGSVDYVNPFATGLGGLADMTFVLEPQGYVLYATINAGGDGDGVRRIAPPPGQTPPPTTPPGTTPPPPPSDALRLVLEPASRRVLDTREGAGVPLVAGVARPLETGVDATTRAVLVNLAYVQPISDGFLTAWAFGAPRPFTANVNAVAGEVVSNLAIVPVDDEGRMQLYSYAGAHVVVDLLGRFEVAGGPVAAGRFAPVPPLRLADTREPTSAANQFSRLPGAPHPLVRVPVLGRGGVPDSGVASVALVVTALSPATPQGGFLTATEGGAAWPGTANLNVNGAADIRPNSVVVPVAADGTIDLHLYNVADVVVDVAGWFSDDTTSPSTAGRFVSIQPTREADSRIGLGFGRLAAGATAVLDPSAVPADATALAHNIAIVDNAGPGFVTPFPGGPLPVVAAGNVTAPGQVRSVLAFTQLSPSATMSYYAYMATDLVVDVTGWFQD